MKNLSLRLFKLLLFSSLCFAFFSSHAEVHSSFIKYTINDGLNNNSVKAIFEDSKGFIWIGTESGMSKYTGREFIPVKPFNNTAHLDKAFIKDIVEGPEGRLWIATIGRGLLIYNPKTNELEQKRGIGEYAFSDISELINYNDTIYALTYRNRYAAFDRDSLLYLYDGLKTNSQALVGFNYKSKPALISNTGNIYLLKTNGKFKKEKSIKLSSTSRIVENISEKKIIIGNTSGIVRIVDVEKSKDVFYSEEFKGFAVKYIIHRENENKTYVSFRGKGLYSLKNGKFEKYKSESRFIETIYFDSDNNLWLGSWEGLYKEQELSRFFKVIGQDEHEKERIDIMDLINSSKGVFYIGNDRILNYDTKANNWEIKKTDFDFSKIKNLNNSKEKKIRVKDCGFDILDENLNLIKKVKFKETLKEMDISFSYKEYFYFDSNYIFLSGPNDLYLFSFRDNSLFKLKYNVGSEEYAISGSPIIFDNAVWINYDGSQILRYDPYGKSKKYDFKVSDIKIEGHIVYNETFFLFFEEGIVFEYNKEEDRFVKLKQVKDIVSGNLLSLDRVKEIKEDKYGGYWINNYGPLYYWEKETGRAMEFDIKNSNLSGVGLNEDFFLLPANSGLYVIDRQNMQKYIKRPEMYMYKFTKEQGLPEDIFLGDFFNLENNISVLLSKEGPMVFNNEVFFNFIEEATKNDIYVISIKANNKSFKLDSSTWYKSEFKLPERTTDVSIHLTTHKTNLQNFFQYRLIGFNKNWINAGNRNHIIYNSLKPGNYTLEIKSNLSNIKRIKIIIPPAWNQTIWFRGILVVLGIVLVYLFLKFREHRLKLKNKYLEDKIFERTKELQIKNNEIIDNMRYARRIQRAMMPSSNVSTSLVNDYFVFLRPRDIVSGDFFYLKDYGNKLVFSVADCTGHGVSGAFMSILGHTVLHQTLNGNINQEPSTILDKIRQHVKYVLHQEGGDDDTKDGMDIGLGILNTETLELRYSGAFISLYIVKDHHLSEIKPDRQPVGYYINEKKFTTNNIQLNKGDLLYLSSDGYPDQIGGKKDKRLYSRRFKKLLVDISNQDLDKQKKFLDRHLISWMGKNEQVDDICVMGLKV